MATRPALVLQVAHPVVGAGVDDHSVRHRHPRTRLPRPGARYYAWVHATAYPSFLRAARYLSHPLSDAEERRLYDELLRLGDVLGIN